MSSRRVSRNFSKPKTTKTLIKAVTMIKRKRKSLYLLKTRMKIVIVKFEYCKYK